MWYNNLTMQLADAIKQKAMELGFDLVGITDASPIDAKQIKAFTDWLAAGYAGQMAYMQNNLDKRFNPAKLLPAARSVIVVGLNYNLPEASAGVTKKNNHLGRVANFAQFEDYHSFIKKQLRKLAQYMTSFVGGGLNFKICVDSAPLAERALAVRAGLGFIGKNHMLVNPDFGPQVLLGEIITGIELPADKPIENGCLKCDACIDACPTGALRDDGYFDANKCISYLTTEYKGTIPPQLAGKIGDRLFGCDECVLACQQQQNKPERRNNQFKFYPARDALDLNEILKLSPQRFELEFANSCMKRLGLERLKRNAELCLANTPS